ncbi:MAG: glutathione S-transferase family protein [Pseudomonadales bacterium]
MLTLWGAGTARTIRAHWMLQELGLEYETKPVGSRTGETQEPTFQALNLKEKIPVLVDDDLVLTESGAIVTYLGTRYGQKSAQLGQPLVPTDPVQRARYDEWMSYILMELDAHTLYVLRKHRDLTALYGEAPAAVATAIDGFNKQIQFAVQQLGQNSYALNEHFTGIDIMLATTLEWAVFYGFTLPETLESYRLRLREREGSRRAVLANRLPE